MGKHQVTSPNKDENIPPVGLKWNEMNTILNTIFWTQFFILSGPQTESTGY